MTPSESSPAVDKKKRHWALRWGLRLTIAVVILLAAMELFCRFYLHLGDPPLSVADPEIEYMFKPNQTVNRFGNIIHYNQWSMKSDDFPKQKSDPKELRVLVIGDSVVNGGAQTANDKTATSILQKNLQEQLHRPVHIANISAGSWGPPNQLAYLKHFGLFDADIIILVLSSHDYTDAPTFDPIVGINSDFPEHRPLFALQEAVTRYLPRYLPVLKNASGDPMGSKAPAQKDIDWCMQSIREIVDLGHAKGIPVAVVQHMEQTELGKPETSGHLVVRTTSTQAGAHVADLYDLETQSMRDGLNIYRDNIHLNIEGQKLLARVFEQIVMQQLHTTTLPASASQP